MSCVTTRVRAAGHMSGGGGSRVWHKASAKTVGALVTARNREMLLKCLIDMCANLVANDKKCMAKLVEEHDSWGIVDLCCDMKTVNDIGGRAAQQLRDVAAEICALEGGMLYDTMSEAMLREVTVAKRSLSAIVDADMSALPTIGDVIKQLDKLGGLDAEIKELARQLYA